MKLIDRLIWRELFSPLLNSIFMFLMVLFASAYLFKVTELLSQGVPIGMVAEVTIYILPTLITQTLPMSMLLGSLLAFGRLSGDSEHIALFASGVSFLRVARPVAWLGLAVSLITIAWNETVVPPAMRGYYSVLQRATENVKVTNRPLEYSIKRDDGSVDEFVSIKGGYDATTRMLRQVTIVKMSDDPKRVGMPQFIVYAEKALARDAKGLAWEYYNVSGQPFLADPGNKMLAYFYFDHATTLPAKNVRIGRDFRGIMQSDVTDNRRMTFRALRDKIKNEREQGNLNTLGDEVDLWEKVSVPMASLIFGLVGAPLGIRPQRGSKAMGFGIAIAIIFLYWVVYHTMYMVGSRGAIAPMLASFTADIIGLVAAVILILRTRQ